MLQLVVGWLVVLGLTALWDNISVYIGPSPKEREKEIQLVIIGVVFRSDQESDEEIEIIREIKDKVPSPGLNNKQSTTCRTVFTQYIWTLFCLIHDGKGLKSKYFVTFFVSRFGGGGGGGGGITRAIKILLLPYLGLFLPFALCKIFVIPFCILLKWIPYLP